MSRIGVEHGECRYCDHRALPDMEWCNLRAGTAGMNKADTQRVVVAHTHAMEVIDARPLGIKFIEDRKRDRRLAWGGPDHLLNGVPQRLDDTRCAEPYCPRLAVIAQPLAQDRTRCWHHQPREIAWEGA